MPPPVPPPPSSEALNGTILDSLDQWQPGASRFIHQQVRGDGRRKSPGALGLKELMWQRLGKPGKEWAQGEGREAGKRPALPTSCHVRGEGRSDQVLITCPRPEQGNSPMRLAVSSRLLGVTRAVPLPPPEHCPSCSLSPHRPRTAPVPKRPVPPSPRTASALHAPEAARKSTSTGTASAPAPAPPARQSRGPARAGGSQGWGPGVAAARGCPASGVIGQAAPRLLASSRSLLTGPVALSLPSAAISMSQLSRHPPVVEELRQDFLPPLLLPHPFPILHPLAGETGCLLPFILRENLGVARAGEHLSVVVPLPLQAFPTSRSRRSLRLP